MSGAAGYILTLGVVEGARGRGLAQALLRKTIEAIQAQLPQLKAIWVPRSTTAAVFLIQSIYSNPNAELFLCRAPRCQNQRAQAGHWTSGKLREVRSFDVDE